VTEVLRAEGIVARFGDRRVLTSATLRAPAGCVTALFGRNGVGKSTLVKAAAGVIRPTSGVVHFRGVARLRATLPALARDGLFYLPDRELLAPGLTLRRQLALFARRYDRPLVDEAAALVGLGGRLDQRADACSGGERRLAEVALAWLRAPACLLADEPFRDVAPIVGETLARALRRMAADGCAVVVTGHEAATLLDLADRVVWCTAGTTYELGTAAEARRHEGFRREYLGSGG
jgi:ABC-type multidrug transport system ATPase subunit